MDPAAERILAGTELTVDQRRGGNARVLSLGVQHEYQPVQACLGRDVEFQLGVGHPGPVPYQRAVPSAQHPDIHITPAHPLGAYLRRSLTGRGKIGHIHDHVPGRGNRPLNCLYVRLLFREFAQLRGM